MDIKRPFKGIKKGEWESSFPTIPGNTSLKFPFPKVGNEFVIPIQKISRIVNAKGRCVGMQDFFGQVMSPHHSDQMSQRSQVSRIAR